MRSPTQFKILKIRSDKHDDGGKNSTTREIQNKSCFLCSDLVALSPDGSEPVFPKPFHLGKSPQKTFWRRRVKVIG